VRDGVCNRCSKQDKTHNFYHTKSNTQRGYGKDWKRLRDAFVHDAFVDAIAQGHNGPRCAFCNEILLTQRYVHVDHIKEFNGLDDEKRLDVSNLRLAHMSCHMAKRGGGGSKSN
jgi:hypothetical protein